MFPSKRQAHAWSRGLGWFSLALGATQLLAAKPLARTAGLGGRHALVRGGGLREIATGMALLNARDPEPWMWMRVAGDAFDLATLLPGGRPGLRSGNTAALAAVAGVTVLDLLCARSLARSRLQAGSGKNYSQRSGLPLPADEMRGAALADFEAPADMRTPPALRPWTDGRAASPHPVPEASAALPA